MNEKEEFNIPKRPGVPVYLDNKGSKQTKDESYAEEFWQKQPAGLKEAMEQNILAAIKAGIFSMFVAPEEGKTFQDTESIDEESKRKLSAYRVLAKEIGYEIGPFTLNKNAHSVKATISKQ
jgi:hypothetical protein